jgi:hypothetical protein
MSYPDYNQNPPPGYGQQSSSLAVISLIAGIASFFIVPLLGAIAAIITGGMAKKEIRQSGGRITGLGMANWGVTLGWINIAFSLIGLCLGLLALLGVVTLPFCIMPFANGFNY